VDEFETSPIVKQGLLRKKRVFSAKMTETLSCKKMECYLMKKGKENQFKKKQINLIQAKAIKKEGNFGIVIETKETTWTLNSLTTFDRNDWIKQMSSIVGVRCDECDMCSQQE